MKKKTACNHRIEEGGDIQVWPAIDGSGERVTFIWCRRCGARKIEADWSNGRWVRPRVSP